MSMTDSPVGLVTHETITRLSWGKFLLLLLVIVALSDVGSMLIGMLRPAVEAQREKHQQPQQIESTIRISQAIREDHPDKRDEGATPTVPAR
jgi:hypothetical protein